MSIHDNTPDHSAHHDSQLDPQPDQQPDVQPGTDQGAEQVAGLDHPVVAGRSELRSSFWRRTFEAARCAGDWFEVPRSYTGKMARQVASDVRCSHKRNDQNRRTRGILPGECWESRWEPVEGGADGDCRVSIRLVTTVALRALNEQFATAG